VSYAEKTSVPSEQSRAEIERTLLRYGASQFMYGWNEHGAVIQFRASDRFVRFSLPMPDKADTKFTRHSRGSRTPDQALKAWEQETRRRWRALALAVKAKLEVVASGISSFESEFMAHIVLPDGGTVAEWLSPQIAEAYERGTMPTEFPLALPAAGGSSA
jgi:hypothetical protein